MKNEDLKDTYWFCLDHHRVEAFAESDSRNRLGPYDTAEQAAGVLDRIAAREKQWRQEDEKWN